MPVARIRAMSSAFSVIPAVAMAARSASVTVCGIGLSGTVRMMPGCHGPGTAPLGDRSAACRPHRVGSAQGARREHAETGDLESPAGDREPLPAPEDVDDVADRPAHDEHAAPPGQGEIGRATWREGAKSTEN